MDTPPKFPPGLYEHLIAESEEALLRRIGDDQSLALRREPLRDAEAGDRLALYFSRVLRASVDGLGDRERAQRGLELVRGLIASLAGLLDDDDWLASQPVLAETLLTAILRRSPDGSSQPLESPLIPLLDTTLLTNAPGEPRVGRQLLTEIASASRIDVVMAFIRSSGIGPFTRSLRRHCESGGSLRILTTTYTNSTELRALQDLSAIGAQIRVSYDTSSTRLHAKSWLFHRPGGMATAYIGSSNLTHQAQRTGMEWNIRVSGARNPAVVEKMAAVFDSYWESGDFEPFDARDFSRRSGPQGATPQSLVSSAAIRLYPFQERMLEQIAVARERGRNRNLLVSATGTGKTVMAAVDFQRLRRQLPRARLLFVAHSIDILRQSLATYRHALHDGDFGELWVDRYQPQHWEQVFASIQSLRARGITHLPRDHFDVVVIDEVHHGAAASYRALLEHLQPRQLLGLTATPERSDGLSILAWFDGRITAELRLWDAIDQHRLVPFDYYGIHDNADLTQVRWTRGAGYDVQGLTNLYTADDAWARLVLEQLRRRHPDIAGMRALGFCVSIDHARFMARVFNERGVAAAAIWSDTPRDARASALKQLRAGDINVLFSVDIFNEGVDVPSVDTLLMLRPTDSPVLFLQQLGRGLRRAEGKSACLVLDFVGQHRREFRFHRRFQALLGGSRRQVEKQVGDGFPFLPAGCHMELEAQAREIVLRNIREAVPGNWPRKVDELRELAASGATGLAAFLEHSGLELADVYQGDRSWSDLRAAAGLPVAAPGPRERTLRRACGRLLHVDDAMRLRGYAALLARSAPPRFERLDSHPARLARMLVASVAGSAVTAQDSLQDGLDLIWDHPQVRAELVELFAFLENRIDHQHAPLRDAADIPLQVHARYTRIEILAALEVGDAARTPLWQTGARWLPEAGADLLAFTLDKTSGQFSPTTRYRDYAISPTLIHWESQAKTRADSETGSRYRHHQARGTRVLLFARERADDRAFWFLGPARFQQAEGEQPMAITWKLDIPLPGDLFTSFAAAVA